MASEKNPWLVFLMTQPGKSPTPRIRLWRLLKARPDPNVAILYLIKCCLHYHQYTMARQMTTGGSRVVNSF